MWNCSTCDNGGEVLAFSITRFTISSLTRREGNQALYLTSMFMMMFVLWQMQPLRKTRFVSCCFHSSITEWALYPSLMQVRWSNVHGIRGRSTSFLLHGGRFATLNILSYYYCWRSSNKGVWSWEKLWEIHDCMILALSQDRLIWDTGALVQSSSQFRWFC